MQKENEKLPEGNMRYVAEKLKERLEKELPVMRRDLESLTQIQQGLLPLAVHNISLCVNERIYLFIEPVLRTYKEALPKQKRKFGIIPLERTEDEKQMLKRIAFLEDLVRKEHILYNQQLAQAKKDIKDEKKKYKADKEAAAKEGKTIPPMNIPSLQERIEFFKHIEIDMYDFIFPLIVLEGRGVLEPNERYYDEINHIREIAISILEEFIPKREKALETAIQVLNSQNEQPDEQTQNR